MILIILSYYIIIPWMCHLYANIVAPISHTITLLALHLLNVELCKSTDWLSANKLSLNVKKKKKCMIFHFDQKTVFYPKLFIDNIEIERLDYFKFLGLQLHHTLKWNKQLRCISLKISKIYGLLHKLKSEYPTSMLKSINNTLILPKISYCILSCGSQIDKLYLL